MLTIVSGKDNKKSKVVVAEVATIDKNDNDNKEEESMVIGETRWWTIKKDCD